MELLIGSMVFPSNSAHPGYNGIPAEEFQEPNRTKVRGKRYCAAKSSTSTGLQIH